MREEGEVLMESEEEKLAVDRDKRWRDDENAVRVCVDPEIQLHFH